MSRLFRAGVLLTLLGLLPAVTIPVRAQMGPPMPADTSAFRGNLFELAQKQPLEYDQQISSLPLGGSSSSSASLIQVRQAVKSHYHAEHDEMVYVLSGRGIMTVGNETRPIQAGDFIIIKRGTVHNVQNRSPQILVALSVMSPPFKGKDRVYVESTDE